MRGFKTIRGYVIGAIAGAVLMIGVQAGASDLLTGSKVAGTKYVTYNGKNIGKAAIINNSSYLPVRAISDAVGLQIDLSGGSINLSEPATQSGSSLTSEPPVSTPPAQQSGTGDQLDIQTKISNIQKSIDYVDANIVFMQDSIKKARDNGYEKDAQNFESQLTQLQQQKADLEAQLQALQNQ